MIILLPNNNNNNDNNNNNMKFYHYLTSRLPPQVKKKTKTGEVEDALYSLCPQQLRLNRGPEPARPRPGDEHPLGIAGGPGGVRLALPLLRQYLEDLAVAERDVLLQGRLQPRVEVGDPPGLQPEQGQQLGEVGQGVRERVRVGEGHEGLHGALGRGRGGPRRGGGHAAEPFRRLWSHARG